MSELLKQSTAVTKKMGPFLDETDGVTEETTLTITQADVRLSKNGGNIAQKSETSSSTHDELGYYGVNLNTTDTNTLGSLRVIIHESGALPVWKDFNVITANAYDSLMGTDKLQVDVTQANGTTVEATSGQFHVLDDAGNAVANEAKQDIIDTNVDDIEAKTTNLPSDPASETNVNANETKIDALNDLSAADVNAEVDTALVDYDGPTKAEMDTAHGLLATEAKQDTIDGNVDAILLSTDTNGVIVATNNDKTGYSLSSAGIQAIWDALTSALVTVGSIGKLLVDNINATISSRSTFNSASDDVSVRELLASALADLFNTDSGDGYATSVSGSVVKEIADNAGGGTPPTVEEIADQVWDEQKAGHVAGGSFGEEVQAHALSTELFDPGSDQVIVSTNNDKTDYALSSAGIQAIWDALTSALTTASSIGKLLVDNIDALISSRSSHSANDVTGGTTVATSESNIRGGTDTLDSLSGQLDTVQADLDDPNQYKADVSGLSTFDHTSDQVIVTTNNDKTGYALSSASIQAIWDALTSALVTVGSIGKLLVDNINATISSRSTVTTAEVNAEVDSALADINLDHLMASSATGTEVIDDSAIAKLASKSATADWDTFDHTTDSLEAIRDNQAGADVDAIATAVWNKLTSALTTVGSIGKLLVDNVDAVISSRSSHSANDITGGTTVATSESNIRGGTDTLDTLSDQLDTAQADLDDPDQYKANVTGMSTFDPGSDQVIVATNNDKTGYALSSAGIQAIWDALTSALITVGSIGKLLVDNINATISSRSVFNSASDDVSVRELISSALADMFNTNSGDDYDTAVAGSVVKEIADNAGGVGFSVDDIADGVWDEQKAGHVAGGSFGEEVQSHALSSELFDPTSDPVIVGTNNDKTGYALSVAGVQAIWDALTSALITVGSVGKLLVDNIDALISSRSNHSANDVTGGTTVAVSESNIRGGTDTLDSLSGQLDTVQADLDNPDQYKADVTGMSTFDPGSDQVIVVTNNDKTGYGLSSAGIQAIWDALTSALITVGSIGKLLVDNINATISSRSTFDPAVEGVIVDEMSVAGLSDFFDVDSGENYGASIPGSVVQEIAENSGEASSPEEIWGYTPRTLTTSMADIATAIDGSDINIHRGDTLLIAVAELGDLTGYVSLDFTVKNDKLDTDDEAILRIRKNASGTGDGLLRINGSAPTSPTDGSITIDDLIAGDITINLIASESEDLEIQSSLYYDIQLITATLVQTKAVGNCNVTADVTKAIV